MKDASGMACAILPSMAIVGSIIVNKVKIAAKSHFVAFGKRDLFGFQILSFCRRKGCVVDLPLIRENRAVCSVSSASGQDSSDSRLFPFHLYMIRWMPTRTDHSFLPSARFNTFFSTFAFQISVPVQQQQ